jgi:hypothetical protein
MDKAKLDWGWMQQHMPRVVAMLKRRRAEGHGEHINECWRRGVQQGEAGWFFAAEGAVTLGVPAEGYLADPVLVEMRKAFPTQALLVLKGDADAPAA